MPNEALDTQELAVVVAPPDRPLTVAEMLGQAWIVQQLLDHVMQEGVHYGKIPGCGDRPTLLLPGAEKINMTFRLAPKLHVEDLCQPPERYRYRVRCALYTIHGGVFVGEAFGEASSDEEKYQWEKALNTKHYESVPPDQRRIKFRKKYKSDEVEEIEQVKQNVADLANTVLKMAVKRAMISASRGATAASDILEVDLDEETVAKMVAAEAQGEPLPKAEKKAKPKPAPSLPFGSSKGKAITDQSVPVDDLKVMLAAKQRHLGDDKRDTRWDAADQAFIAAINEELKIRTEVAAADDKPHQPAAQQPSAAAKQPDTKQAEPAVIQVSDDDWRTFMLDATVEHADVFRKLMAEPAFRVKVGLTLPLEKRSNFMARFRELIKSQ